MKKNIVIVMTDEQSWNTLRVFGNTTLATPHADALARDGVALDHCFTAYPLCCPARSSLWTGLWPHNHHVTGNWLHLRPDLQDAGLIKPFRDGGYHTVYCGKWHVPGTTPERFGVDDASAIPAVIKGQDRGRFILEYRDYAAGQGYKLNEKHMENLTDADIALLNQPGKAPCGRSELPSEHYLEVWQTGKFLEALERCPDDQPFFAVVSYNAPHFPLIVPHPYDTIVDPEQVQLPPNYHGTMDGKPAELKDLHYLKKMEGLPDSEWRRFIAHYLGFCAMMDDQLGRITAYLKEKGVYDDTIVVFTSDHGDMMGAHKLIEKGQYLHYDEALRVPMIVANAGVEAGKLSEAFVMLHDLLPTLAESSGVAMHEPTDAVSFARQLNDADAPSARDCVLSETFKLAGDMNGFGEYKPPGRFQESDSDVHLSIRTREYRYTFHYQGADELYDKVADPYELNNVAGEAKYLELLSSARSKLIQELRGNDAFMADLVEGRLAKRA
ncbi:sulfatase-like hydrolase/transferase [Paenibacillus cremeus]|uniref:Sulfatase-like hydrolase/transferase n=1 Tax=Paenibacillus cremeus TaxID=2163881 RepID=A0A559KG34_9BACL|nr:sulfatase-like hydrolase/transferase [Paenibacillus cremeus]TVY11094.1 sulfatase-like hydrolase/transferase [Paenibacillus cremeus]